MVQMIIKEDSNSKSYQLCDVYQHLSEGVEQDAKAIEQRVRRANTKGLHNLANLGIDDYYNEIFSPTVLRCLILRRFARNEFYSGKKPISRGKINVKKLLRDCYLLVNCKLNNF